MIENEMKRRELAEEDQALLDREMDRLRKETTIAYILLIILGIFGVHKFYLGKVWMGILYVFTGGLALIGIFYDLVTLPQQVHDHNCELEADLIDRINHLRSKK